MHPERERIVCIGGAAVDRKYRATEPVHLRTSNPVTSERSFGGVARNVAENIVRLGAHSSLVSMIGRDENGAAIQARLTTLGIDTQHVVVSGNHTTAEYVAVLEPNGDLALGLADMAIFDALTPALLRECWPHISTSWVFADCNLPSPTLHELVDRARQHSSMLAVDAVSMLKVTRLPQDLTGVGLLFLNLDEAQALLGWSDPSPQKIAAALLERGVARVVLTLGASGSIASDRSGWTSIEAVPVQVVDATGAGDALIAATLVALMRGRSLADAVQMGTVAAALTLECPDSVRPDLSVALLEAVMSQNTGLKLEEGTR